MENKKGELLETDPETVKKLFYSKPYSVEDMKKCAKQLFFVYNYDFKRQFSIAETSNSFVTELDKYTKRLGFVLYNKSRNKPQDYWTLFCIIPDENKYNILYKDPAGGEVPYTLKQKIIRKLSNVKFLVHRRNDQELDTSTGPLSLRNLNIMLESLNTDQTNFINNYDQVEFCDQLKIREEKFSVVLEFAILLFKNEDFKSKLKELVDNVPLELNSNVGDYLKVLEEELQAGEGKMDKAKIEKARKDFLRPHIIEQFQNDYNLSNADLELKIEDEFSEELGKLKHIFEILGSIKLDDRVLVALNSVSAMIGMDVSMMEEFYEYKVKKEEEQPREILQPVDLEEVTKRLPLPEEQIIDDCSTIEELLEGIVLDEDEFGPKKLPLSLVDELRDQYNLVKRFYVTAFSFFTVPQICAWATEVRGHLTNICEAVAVMDRAYYLLTGKHNLRKTQILAVLIFFRGPRSEGMLCQMKPGEGKTVVVAMLAIVRALQGKRVDIITSSSILAEKRVEEMKSFYNMFGLTVATNNAKEGDSDGFKVEYGADVLYGTISNFQADFLRDSFEGCNIRGDRKFGQVILDEIDSLLVDQGGHIAKMGESFPGMENLRYVYIKIWEELHKAEKSFVEESKERVEEWVDNVVEKYKNNTRKAQKKFEKFVTELVSLERELIKGKVMSTYPGRFKLIPAHLREYVMDKVEDWVDSAIFAKYHCHEYEQYRIIKRNGERVVVPVDYLNTGVTMGNTIWSNGLQQFLQLKHNLHLTPEVLTTSFISNINYIKKYKSKNVFGVTGSLGSRAEQQFLSNIYFVTYAKLPTYKPRVFRELNGIVAKDANWHLILILAIIEKIEGKRAVLVVLETEKDLLCVKQDLEILKQLIELDFRLRVCVSEDNAEEIDESENEVKVGDVILVTNLTGREMSLTTEDELEESGGLHVCVGFLPCNQRVEGQAFGCTSHEGHSGSANLIIRQSEVDWLGIRESKPNFHLIKTARDQFEKLRLEETSEGLVKELIFKDELFEQFSEFYASWKEERCGYDNDFFFRNLKEFWTFWLDKRNFNSDSIKNTTPDKEFGDFKKLASGITQEDSIQHNPYYYIQQADYHLKRKERHQAEKLLNLALKTKRSDNFELLYGAHLKLFEVLVEKREQILERFRYTCGQLFSIGTKKHEYFSNDAVLHLKNAKNALEQEINYLRELLCLRTDKDVPLNEIIVKDVDAEENLFLKHIYSRVTCLGIYFGNVAYLLENIESMNLIRVEFTAFKPGTIETFNEIDETTDFGGIITQEEIDELGLVGLNTLYAMKEIPYLRASVAAQNLIGAGLGALAVGTCYHPLLPIMAPTAATLISEGVIDIITELTKEGDLECPDKDFIKAKFVTHAISLLTTDSDVTTQSTRILTEAIASCRTLSSTLRRNERMANLCSMLATHYDNFKTVLTKILVIAKFDKLSKVGQLMELTNVREARDWETFQYLGGLSKLHHLQNLSRIGKLEELSKRQVLASALKSFVKEASKNLVGSVVEEHVIGGLISDIIEVFVIRIKEKIKLSVHKSINADRDLSRKLFKTPREDVQHVVTNFMASDEVLECAKELASELYRICDSNSKLEVFNLSANVLMDMEKISCYSSQFCSFLEHHLREASAENRVEEMIEEISNKAAERVLDLVQDLFKISQDPYKGGASSAVKKTRKAISKTFASVLGRRRGYAGLLAQARNPVDNPYLILGVKKSASAVDVRKAYLNLVLKFHPEKNPDNPFAKERFEAINAAYEEIGKVLSK
jgi:hypothetical protein